jgi:flagellar basal body-associated protein FliL
LILGVLIAGWHLPLMVVGQVSYSDIVLILAAVIVFNWVFNNARGSVLIIMLMHAANNAVSGSFFSRMFSGADSTRESWLLALVWIVAAALVIAISGPANFSRKHHKQEESLPHAEPETVGPVSA